MRALKRHMGLMRGHGQCHPAKLIRNSPQTEIVRHRDGDTPDIIETILWMDAHSGRWVVMENVECLRGDTDEETMLNVWRFVKQNVRYKADRPGHERVKSPGALYTSGTGDCKSFSISEGALLRALGIPYRYRFAAYTPGDFTHVYVVAKTRTGWVPLDAVHDAPFEEVPYHKKKDIAPMAALNGLDRETRPSDIDAPASADWRGVVLAGFILLILTR